MTRCDVFNQQWNVVTVCDCGNRHRPRYQTAEKASSSCSDPNMCVFQVGDRVFTTATVSGAYAEYAVADDDCVYHLPDALDFAQGSAIGIPYFTAYRAVVQK